ncbi:inactive rhomboid protein 1 [Tripterygium wilfordii]|uniref:RHOMBOID-like protein n=1 Tax=Tripterygium wilfordii TaxID=458696 RepID=A0A7J7DE97_TRIWF|nr:RHOMBOID-like protein 1 [Tripterygium wilfordii]KAF5744599.1 inactive rhomboid protein 1 [Tripterygium wilfordii]
MMGRGEAKAGVEIKVSNPRRGDNVVHPESGGQNNEATSTRPSRALGHRSQHHFVSDFKPFKRWFPWLVPTFVVVNILIFVVTMYINNCPKNSASCVANFVGRFSFQPLKENPLLGPSSTTLEKMGALEVNKVVYKHQAWRLISCIWLHAGVFHVLANMLSLVFIGIRLEQEFGFVRIGLLYVISGFGGSLLSALFIQIAISVGASGALFGLLGGMLSELITNWTIYANKLAALLTLVFIIILNLAVGILPHVDNFAHIGGFLSGFFLGFVFLIRPQFGWVNQKSCPPGYIAPPAKSKHKAYQYVLWVISLILLTVGFTLGLVFLLRGVDLNDHCSWCHYLSCVPTSKWSCKSHPSYCESSQLGNQLNLTCITNKKSNMYMLSDNSSSQVEQLCSQLCS